MDDLEHRELSLFQAIRTGAHDPEQRELLKAFLTVILRSGFPRYEEPSPLWRRRGAAAIINALLEVAQQLDIDRQLRRPLVDIRDALRDADRGVLHSLFEADHPDNRPGISADRLRILENAALAMDCYMRAGLNKKDAARQVAKILEDFSVPLKGREGTEPWVVVAGWRSRLSQAAKSVDASSGPWYRAGAQYERKKQRLFKMGGTHPELRRLALERLLKVKASMARGPEKGVT